MKVGRSQVERLIITQIGIMSARKQVDQYTMAVGADDCAAECMARLQVKSRNRPIHACIDLALPWLMG